MKKILSLALAFVMIFAVCVPAFANVSNGSGGNNTTVLVDGTNGGTYNGDYTVSIPAEVYIPWEQVDSDVEYAIWSQLATGKKVHVMVASADNGIMSNDADTATLNYSLVDGTTEYTTTKSVILESAPETSKVVVNIPTSVWKSTSIDKYSGTLTFTAELI